MYILYLCLLNFIIFIAYHISKDNTPLRTVEMAGFKYLLNTMSPKYVIPSRYLITQDIKKLYTEKAGELIAQIQMYQYFSITTDAWTSTQNKSYITTTISYLDNEWKYINKVLQTRECDVSY